MRRYEKLATHALLFCVFAACGLNIMLALGGRLQAWNVPVLYGLYVAGVFGVRKLCGQKLTSLIIGLAILLPALGWLLALGMSHAYDTSWDGQDYHQSAVIALADGWNPWRTDMLPIHLPASQEYIQGYPKTTWLLQAGIYQTTGRLQAAVVTNVVVGAAAAALVFGLLRRLGLGKPWAVVLTLLAVGEIHFLQQLPTFMADGYSYQLSLAGIAALCMVFLERRKYWPLAACLSSWLLLAGSKFSNLFVCALLGGALAVYMYRAKLYRDPIVQKILAVAAAVGLLMLWVPYGRNVFVHHSPVYPQNQAWASQKLRFDNVPNNLKHANRAALLFYGIFSSTEPPTAGDPVSPQNVAQLKWPFTFRSYEVHEVNNFQGRVGSGGILFSGIVVLTVTAFVALVALRPKFAAPGLFPGVSIVLALIVLAALIIPVSNKLRYSPLVTAVPLLVALLLLRLKNAKLRWPRITAGLIILCVAINTVVAAGALLAARINDAQVINAQLNTLRQSGATYHVHAASFYAHYVRLQEHGVHILIDPNLSCSQPQALAYSFSTTLICR